MQCIDGLCSHTEVSYRTPETTVMLLMKKISLSFSIVIHAEIDPHVPS